MESSHRLKEIYQASDRILDFNYNKLLATNEINYSHPRIINMSNGAEENLTVKDSVKTGYLTYDGSMVESRFNNLCTLYEYNNGQVINLGVATLAPLKLQGCMAFGIKIMAIFFLPIVFFEEILQPAKLQS